jgi:malate synthase
LLSLLVRFCVLPHYPSWLVLSFLFSPLLRANISSTVQYLSSWIAGRGAVALNGLMEDMATAEISRTQLWQWYQYQVDFTRADGTTAKLTPETFQEIFESTVSSIQKQNEIPYAIEYIPLASQLLLEMVKSSTCDEFIQDRAYCHLNRAGK